MATCSSNWPEGAGEEPDTAKGARAEARAPHRSGTGSYGNEVTFDGTVSVPEVGAPVSLITCAY